MHARESTGFQDNSITLSLFVLTFQFIRWYGCDRSGRQDRSNSPDKPPMPAMRFDWSVAQTAELYKLRLKSVQLHNNAFLTFPRKFDLSIKVLLHAARFRDRKKREREREEKHEIAIHFHCTKRKKLAGEK